MPSVYYIGGFGEFGEFGDCVIGPISTAAGSIASSPPVGSRLYSVISVTVLRNEGR